MKEKKLDKKIAKKQKKLAEISAKLEVLVQKKAKASMSAVAKAAAADPELNALGATAS